MTAPDWRVLDRVRDSLGEARLARAIVYLDDTPRRAGEQVRLGDVVIELPWDGLIAFADLEPEANWGHACCYLAVSSASGAVSRMDASLPPFLKAGTAFHLLWRGPLAPEWAVAAAGHPE